MPREHAFDIDSTAGRYWLANGSGFELVEGGGRKLGVVEGVVLDPATQRVTAMVVRRRAAIGRAHVPPQDLTAVVPGSRLFVVRPGSTGELTRTTARAVASSAFADLHRFASASAPVIAAGARRFAAFVTATARFARARWPAARRALAAAGVAVLAGLRWLADVRVVSGAAR